MAALEVLALNTVIPQIQAPQVGDSYLFPRVAEFSAGTALLPSLAGPSDPDTGMWFPAANTIAWSTGGTERMRITSAGNVGIGKTPASGVLLDVNGVAAFGAGTALLPSLAATGDLDTGMWFPAANTLAWSTGGSERMRITSAGEVGIGTSTPTGFIPLTILANSNNAIALNIRGRSDGIGVLLFSDNSDVENGRIDFRTNYAEIKQNRNAPLLFSTNGSEKMRLTAAGDLGLGTTPGGGMKLDILGGNVNLTNGTYAAYQVVSGTVTGQLAANAGGTVDVRAVSNHAMLLYTNNTERIRIDTAGNTAIGTSTTAGVRLTVRGSGTSSSTTGLLVEDSAGTDNFTIRDDGAYAFRGGTVGLAQTGYTTFTNLTTDRTCDADTVTVAELADIVGTLIVDLKTKGIIAT